jgi:hypothetical protein
MGNEPSKSIPVTVNALSPRSLKLGKLSGYGALYGCPFTRQQLAQARTTALTCPICWMDVIQKR